MKTAAAIAVLSAVLLSGCMTRDPYTGELKTSHATQNATIGAMLGAGIGALTNTHGCCAGENALAGAAIGGLAGGLIGRDQDYREARLRHRLARYRHVRVYRRGDQIAVDMPNEILFASGSAAVSPKAQAIVADIADVVRRDRRLFIAVDGYTDTVGPARANFELSRRRAENVADLLVMDGIPARRIEPHGFGETHLAVATPDNTAEARNRRVVIRINPRTA